MPIYAYRCSNCGHAQDVLQKISDPVLAVCPACGQAAYVKQVTAAGFQLKGSGWYVTDFRGDNKAGAKPAASGESAEGGDAKGASTEGKGADATPAGESKPEAKGVSKGGEAAKKVESAPAAAPAASSAPAPAPAPSGKTGS